MAETELTKVDETSVKSLNRLVKLTELLLQGTASKHYKWVTELDEALRASVSTPINLTFSYREGARGNHSVQSNSLYQILTLLRDSLLHMRYEEATEILKQIISGCRVKMPFALETAIYRSGLEIMFCLPNLARPPLADFVHNFKRVGAAINPQRGVIDQFIYTLTSKGVEEAAECISFLPRMNYQVAKAQKDQIALLYRAYKGLSFYLEYEKQQRTQRSTQSLSQSFHAFSQQQHSETTAESALAEFAAVTDQPGVWDMFIACQIDLLEYFRREDEALRVLQDYKSRNEDNPSSYRNLIDFHRCHGNHDDYRKELEQYCKRWPSDKSRCLQLFDELDINVEYELATTTLFSLLDYSCHRGDVSLWQRFVDFLADVIMSDSPAASRCLSQRWSERKSWWRPFHFGRSMSEGSVLSAHKSKALTFLDCL